MSILLRTKNEMPLFSRNTSVLTVTKVIELLMHLNSITTRNDPMEENAFVIFSISSSNECKDRLDYRF